MKRREVLKIRYQICLLQGLCKSARAKQEKKRLKGVLPAPSRAEDSG